MSTQSDGGGAPAGLPELSVRGGAGGIEARHEDIMTFSRLLDVFSDRVTDWALDDSLKAADGDLLASAVLSPVTAAQAETAVLAATVGPGGLLPQALAVEALGLSCVVNVKLQQAADKALAFAIDELGYVIGRYAAHDPFSGALPLGALALTAHATGDESWLGGAQRGLRDGIAESPLLMEGFRTLSQLPLGATVNGVAGDLYAGLNGERRRGVAVAAEAPVRHDVPHTISDVAAAVDRTSGGESGRFTVQQLTDDHGNNRWIVHLPGTDFGDWDSARDFAGNLQLLDGGRTAYGDAVAESLARAGVGPDDPVLLSGHSQGGMQAMALADDPDFGYNVSGVLTWGSPVANVEVSDEVTVLSVENSSDPVPLTDGGRNDSGTHHVTVSGEVDVPGPLGEHDLTRSYGPLSLSVDASQDPSVRAVLDRLHSQGFLTDDPSVHSTTRTFAARVAP